MRGDSRTNLLIKISLGYAWREFEPLPGYYLKPSKQSQINRFFAIKALQIAIELRADRTILHKKPGCRIAEINLAYTTDLIVLDGLQCFVSGGPTHGKKVASGVMIAGGDRLAVDAVRVAVLKFYKAEGIAGVQIKDHEQLKRAAEIGLGHLDIDMIALETSNMANDEKFYDLVSFVKRQL